ncbi:MAG: EI24 domain-containing protein [Chitinophagaceae bacterium]
MLKEIVIAFQSYIKAHRFISKHRLWKWIIIPGLLYMALFVFCMILFSKTATSTVDHFTLLLKDWVERIDLGWVSFLISIAGLLLWLLMMLFYFSLFKYIFLIIGSPLFAYLSEKTESIMDGRDFPISFKQLLRDIARGVRLALRNTLWQTVYTIAVIILSFIPLVGWAAPVLSLFIECYYYGFSMLDYSCERHRLSTAQSISFIGNHKGLAIGNGFIFYLMHLLPFVGWVLAPSYAVVAATISMYHQKDQF